MGAKNPLDLYIKATCSMCLGGLRKGIFVNCPYCDVDRKCFVEASFKTIKEELASKLTDEQKKELIKAFQEE